MTSSYACGAVLVQFTVNMDNYRQVRENMLRTWDLELYLTAVANFTLLDSVVCALTSVRVCPGSNGSTPYVDVSGQGTGVGGGIGTGTLTIDNLIDSPYTAILTRLTRPSAYPGGGARCQATFQEFAQ